MSDKAISLVKDVVKAITPDYPKLTKVLLVPAEIFWFVSFMGRKIRLLSNPKNLVPLMAGSILDATVGNQPTVQKAARIVFGSASILKCSQDILCIVQCSRTIITILKGDSYVAVKKKTWEGLEVSKYRSPSHIYSSKLFKARYPILIKRIFWCVVELFKAIGMLALHFTDAVTAYRQNNTTSEIFVHGIDIYHMLTDSESEIVKNLKRLENITDMVASKKKMGNSWRTTALIGLFVLPAKFRQRVPGVDELLENFVHNFGFIREKFEAMEEFMAVEYLAFLNKSHLINRVPKEMVPEIERQFEFFAEEFRDSKRFIQKPILK